MGDGGRQEWSTLHVSNIPLDTARYGHILQKNAAVPGPIPAFSDILEVEE